MESIWQKNVIRPQFESLKGDRKTDVLIIGGGATGILCAYFFKQAGMDCILVEADRICSGVTQNTTAKITVQHGLIYEKMIGRFGVEYAKCYFQAQQQALERYRAMCKNFLCDFEEKPSFLYSKNDRRALERELSALEKIGARASFTETIPLPIPTVGAIRMEEQAQFHPLKFLFALAKDLPIFEKTRVLAFDREGVRTADGRIRASKIVVATHFPFLNKHGAYFLKQYQHRSYEIVLENVPKIDGMYRDAEQKGLSFRSYRNLLLLGGGGHRTGKQGGGWQELRDFATTHYPAAREVCKWATQDCMTLDEIPYIGQYSARTPNLYVATGYNKWGMTSSMVAAELLRDLLQGKQNEFAHVFSPTRSILRSQLAINIAESFLGLITPTTPRCPHMGCALHYNRAEHSWDCGCHGSRFDSFGKLLDNPANVDKNR